MANHPDASSAVPKVTVIIQTYNRSNILGFVIQSVIAQTYADWELLVVGDGCTDDTAAVVAQFRDSRVRFVNLEPRIGDQSGPTNEGLRVARGQYVALLNHDDFWFPDHLERALGVIEMTGADLVFSLQLELDPDGRWRINTIWPGGRFDPVTHPNASTWLFRLDFARRVGALRKRDEVWSFPTREWLWRAHRMDASMAAVPAVTVIVISSTTRRNVYSERQSHEHARVHADLTGDAHFREKCLAMAWAHARPSHLHGYSLGRLLKAAALRALGRLFELVGGDPMSLYCYYRFPRKWGFVPTRGALLVELYRRRGLPKEDA